MTLVETILSQASPERLKRAVDGLCDGSLTITLASQSEAEIRGFVRNGDGKEYGVVISAEQTFCSCKDAMYRRGICKHAVALALHVLRNPRQEQEPEETTREQSLAEQYSYNLRLARSRSAFGSRQSA
jgi:uncharacterized Zn finger protein